MALAALLALAVGGRARADDDLLNELRTVASVRLEGVRSVSQGEIRKVLKTRSGGIWPWSHDPALRLDFLRADTSSIAAIYRHDGFLEARAEYLITSTGKGDKVDVRFRVTEGPRSRIASVTVNGVTAMNQDALLRKLWARTGRAFDPAFLQLDTLKIASLYQEIGYRPHTQASITRDGIAVHVRYDIIEGLRYHFGDVYVSGLVRVREYLVRRELRWSKGEVYRASRVQQGTEHLYESGLFDRVQITTIPDSTTQSMFFDVLIHERKPRWIDAGLGTGTSERFRATASWGHRNLNSRGLQGAVTYTLAFDQNGRFLLSRPEVGLLSPWLFGLRVPARLSAYYEDKNDRADPRWLLQQKTEGVAIELRRDLTRHSRISLTQDNSFVRQNFSYRLPISQETQDSLAQYFVSSYRIHKIQLALDRDTRDNPLVPSRGSTQSLSSQIAGGILKGETSFHKHIAEFRWYLPFRGDFLFASRIRGGIIQPFGESEFSPDTLGIDDQVRRIPVEDRFRLGGATSIRGFNEDEISQGGSGGLAMLLANAEVRFPVYKLLHGEAFLDVGNAWARPAYIDWGDFWPIKSDKLLAPQDVRYVVGTGVSVQLPVGAVRVDWSWALRNAPGRDRIVGRWQFAIGPSF